MKKKIYYWLKFLPLRIKMYGLFYAIQCPLSKSHNKIWKIKKKVLLKKQKVCQMCGVKYNLTIDHILPLSKGGKNNFHNLQLLCSYCNCKKSNKIKKFNFSKGCVIKSTWKSPYLTK